MTTSPKSTRPTIALVGLGNIGFRHLQGLKTIAGDIRLTGVDVSDANLARARAEWGDADALFTTGATPPGARADLLILATSSQGRLRLLKEWGDRLAPRHVVLEKVAFTRMADFDAAAAWAAQAGANIVVNCPRRMLPLYWDLRARVAAESGPIEIAYVDPDLGIGCNGIHIVDVLQYLSGEAELRTTRADFHRVYESRRAGYKDVYGVVEIESPSGHRLRITAIEGDRAEIRCAVRRGALDLRLDQATGRIETADGVVLIDLGRIAFQSELTGTLATDLLRTGRSLLPSLAESAIAHRALIEPLEAAFDKAGLDRTNGLPIT